MSVLVEPVALIGWAILLVTIFAWRWSSQGARGLAWTLTGLLAAYFGFTTPLTANLMVGILERWPAGPEHSVDTGQRVYAVLAGGKTGAPTSAADIARLQEASFRRTVAAARLVLRDPGSLLVVAGGTGDSVTEADLMRHLALTLGVDEDRILLERVSKTTYESAIEVTRLLHGLRQKQVCLVTSAIHMPRAAAVFRAQGIEVSAHAVDHRYVRPTLDEAFIPQVTALTKSTAALHEFVGYAWYYLTNRL